MTDYPRIIKCPQCGQNMQASSAAEMVVRSCISCWRANKKGEYPMTDALDHCTACGGRLERNARGWASCSLCYRATSEKLAASVPATDIPLTRTDPWHGPVVNAAGQVFLAPESVAAMVEALGAHDTCVLVEEKSRHIIATMEQRNRDLVQSHRVEVNRLENTLMAEREQNEQLRHRLAQRDALLADMNQDYDGTLYDATWADGHTGTAQDASGGPPARAAEGKDN